MINIEIEYLYILLFAFILSIIQENITKSVILYKESLKYKNEYYSYTYYLPKTTILKKNIHILEQELDNLGKSNWDDFPNYKISTNDNMWQFILLYHDKNIINKNIQLFKKTNKVIKYIDDNNIVNVYFSKVSPNTSIELSNNEKNYFISNNIIRLYYVISCGKDSKLIVNKKEFQNKKKRLLLFDLDYNIKYINNSNIESIILVIDFEKPEDIKQSNYKLYNKKLFDKYVNNITN
jgi:hypothetical protein